jgi:hypothetical protein
MVSGPAKEGDYVKFGGCANELGDRSLKLQKQ